MPTKNTTNAITCFVRPQEGCLFAYLYFFKFKHIIVLCTCLCCQRGVCGLAQAVCKKTRRRRGDVPLCRRTISVNNAALYAPASETKQDCYVPSLIIRETCGFVSHVQYLILANICTVTADYFMPFEVKCFVITSVIVKSFVPLNFAFTC